MANDTQDRGRIEANGANRPDEAALSARLDRLGARLSAQRHDRNQSEQQGGIDETAARASGLARGLRLSSELVAGVVVGVGIGWGIDRLLSTSPFGLIVFFLLGFAAGVINLMRVAGVAPSPYERLKEPEQKN